MNAPIYLVDAFSHGPFTGNPAGVCLLEEPADPSWMQCVGAEMNQAETAFVWPIEGGYSLRWFTPLAEVDLCGHATLASAHVLWETNLLHPAQEARFHTLSGWLICKKTGDGIEMDFPAELASPADPPELLMRGLQGRAVSVHQSRLDFLVELGSSDEVNTLEPDTLVWTKLDARGVIVTAPSSRDDCDFVSRYFAPAYGIPEDPVTGSIHCTLGPFWAERFGKPNLLGYQDSRRGGYVGVVTRGDRVTLKGKADITLQGELRC